MALLTKYSGRIELKSSLLYLDNIINQNGLSISISIFVWGASPLPCYTRSLRHFIVYFTPETTTQRVQHCSMSMPLSDEVQKYTRSARWAMPTILRGLRGSGSRLTSVVIVICIIVTLSRV